VRLQNRGRSRGIRTTPIDIQPTAVPVATQLEHPLERVEDTVLHWEAGRMLIFDDTYRHEVQNNTDQERVVLILHFDRPMNRLGRFTHRCLIGFIRHTPFVKKAVRNHKHWQDRFRKQLGQANSD